MVLPDGKSFSSTELGHNLKRDTTTWRRCFFKTQYYLNDNVSVFISIWMVFPPYSSLQKPICSINFILNALNIQTPLNRQRRPHFKAINYCVNNGDSLHCVWYHLINAIQKHCKNKVIKVLASKSSLTVNIENTTAPPPACSPVFLGDLKSQKVLF